MRLQKRFFKLYKKEKVIEVDDQKIEYEVERRNVKYARLEFFGRKLIVILPKNYKNEEEIITRKINWIAEKYKYLSSVLKKELIDNFLIFGKKIQLEVDGNYVNFEGVKLRKKDFLLLLKNILLEKVAKVIERYSNEMKVKVGKIIIRSQKTKWASLSSNGTLSFNIKLISLPEDIVEYVVYHEMLHFFEKKHNLNFLRRIKVKFEDVERKEEELNSFWVSLLENNVWRRLLEKQY